MFHGYVDQQTYSPPGSRRVKNYLKCARLPTAVMSFGKSRGKKKKMGGPISRVATHAIVTTGVWRLEAGECPGVTPSRPISNSNPDSYVESILHEL